MNVLAKATGAEEEKDLGTTRVHRRKAFDLNKVILLLLESAIVKTMQPRCSFGDRVCAVFGAPT